MISSKSRISFRSFITVAAFAALSAHATTYTLQQSGNWSDPATWGVPSGYPSASGDAVVISKNYSPSPVVDLNGQSYSIKSINCADLQADVTFKNGSITVSDTSYVKIQAAKTVIFENVNLTSTCTGTSYKDKSFDPYVSGSKIVYSGNCTIDGFFFRHYKEGISLVFTNGVVSNVTGFNYGDTVNPFTMEFTNARLSVPSMDLNGHSSNARATIRMKLGANNASPDSAVLTLNGKFYVASGSSLTVDATAMPAGTYKLIQANPLNDNAGFASGAVVTTASGLTGSLSLVDNVLSLEITGGQSVPSHYGALVEAVDGDIVDVRNDTVANYVDNYAVGQCAAAGGNAQTANDRPKSVYAFGQIFENVIPGETYTVGSESFTVSNAQPRQINVPCNDAMNAFVSNVRDLGGWTLVNGNGRKTNFGVFFRSAKLDGISSAITHNVLTADLGIKTEIDLRPTSEAGAYVVADGATHFGTIAYYNCGMTTTSPNSWREPGSSTSTDNIRKAFAAFGDAAKLPAIFHCSVGRDRTGLLAHVILQLCGVDRDSIYRDYYLTNFAHPEDGNAVGSTNPDARYVYFAGLTGKYGSSDAAHAREYLENCGVTDAQMGAVTYALTGETLAEVITRAESGAPILTGIAAPTAATGLVYNGSAQTGVAAGNGYTLTGDFSATNAGDYEATATLVSGFKWNDDTTEPKLVQWSIAKASLTAKPNDEIVAVGAAVPSFTVSYTGFVGSDDESVLTGTPTCSTEYTAASAAGTYPITISSLPQAVNYTLTAAAGQIFAVSSGEFDPAWGWTVEGIGPFHNETVLVFTNTSSAISWIPPYTDMDSLTVRVLAIGGGGGGGGAYAGGGGAGEYYESSDFTLQAGATYSITIGAGGAGGSEASGGSSANQGVKGGDTVLAIGNTESIRVLGGGGGGSGRSGYGDVPVNSGSGGGGGGWTAGGAAGVNVNAGSGGTGLANMPGGIANDGFGAVTRGQSGGGGGGAGEAGHSAYYGSGSGHPNGGLGVSSDITGETRYYAGGGGGAGSAGSAGSAYGTGGSGVGGNGAHDSVYATRGAANTGSGGGAGTGGSTSYSRGASGGSGVLIIRYTAKADVLKIDAPTAADGLVYNGSEQIGVASGTGYTLTGVFAATNAGLYEATATLQQGYAWSDDTTGAKTLNWSIAKAALTATPVREVIAVGSEIPAFTASYVGFVGTDTESVLSGTPVFATEYTSASSAGSYSVTITTLPQSANYDLQAVAGQVVAIESGEFNPAWGWTAEGIGPFHDENVIVFTNTASEIFWVPPYDSMDSLTVRVLAVGGGGGGGGAYAGGGGAGEFYEENAFTLQPNAAYAITIGAGGTGGSEESGGSLANQGTAGGDTVLALRNTEPIRVLGGGGGGSGRSGFGDVVANSGSGGGGGGYTSGGTGGTYAGSGGTGRANMQGGIVNDGFGAVTKGNNGGGGGGAGEAGHSAYYGSGSGHPNGGLGLSSDITGETRYYAGGGGGAGNANGTGGSGVGGDGAHDSVYATPGTANTGSGGGAGKSGSTEYSRGASGGSGVLIIRYTVKSSTLKIDLPAAVTGLVYDGTGKTGVVETAGITLSGDVVVTNAGQYTAIATLDSGYSWYDESLEGPQEIVWSVAKATNSWTVVPAVTKGEWWTTSIVKGEITQGETLFGVPVATIAKDGGEAVAFDGVVPLDAGAYTNVYTSVETDNWFAPEAAVLSVTFDIRDGEPGEYDYGNSDTSSVTYKWNVEKGEWGSIFSWTSSVDRADCYGIPNELDNAIAEFPSIFDVYAVEITNERGLDIAVKDFVIKDSSPDMTIDLGGRTLTTKHNGNNNAIREFGNVTFRNGTFNFDMNGVYGLAYKLLEGGSITLEDGATVYWSQDPYSEAEANGAGLDINVSGGSKWIPNNQITTQKSAYGVSLNVEGPGSEYTLKSSNVGMFDSTITASNGGVISWDAFDSRYDGSTLLATGQGSRIDLTSYHSQTFAGRNISFTAKDGGSMRFSGRGYNDTKYGLSGYNEGLSITIDNGTATTGSANVFNFGTVTNELGSLGAPKMTFKGAAPLFDARCDAVIGADEGSDQPTLEFAPQATWTNAVIEVAAGMTFTINPNAVVKISVRGGAFRGVFPIAHSATADAIKVDLATLNANTQFDRPPFSYVWRMSDDGKTLYVDYHVTDATIIMFR